MMKIGRNERGFTLIELMVVLIIIGILAAIAIPIMSKQTDKAKNKRAVSELKSMKTIVDIYTVDPIVNTTGNAPTADAAGIDAVLQAGGVQAGLVDPWGQKYQYRVLTADAKQYVLYSLGSDGDTAGKEIAVTDKTNPEENVTITVANYGTAYGVTP